MEITFDSVLRRRENLLAENVDDALVMIDPATGEFYGLESIALRIWQLLEQPTTPHALCAQLTAEYNVDADTCRRDVLDFLAELDRENMIEASGPQ